MAARKPTGLGSRAGVAWLDEGRPGAARAGRSGDRQRNVQGTSQACARDRPGPRRRFKLESCRRDRIRRSTEMAIREPSVDAPSFNAASAA